MFGRSRTHRTRPRADRFAYPGDSRSHYPSGHRSTYDRAYGPDHDMPRRRGYGQRYFDEGMQDPPPRRRPRTNPHRNPYAPTFPHPYAFEADAPRERHRRQRDAMDDLVGGFAGLNIGGDRSRRRSDRDHRRNGRMREEAMRGEGRSRRPQFSAAWTPMQEAEYGLNNAYRSGTRRPPRDTSRDYAREMADVYAHGRPRLRNDRNGFCDRMRWWF